MARSKIDFAVGQNIDEPHRTVRGGTRRQVNFAAAEFNYIY
jgi:hypothetical protein